MYEYGNIAQTDDSVKDSENILRLTSNSVPSNLGSALESVRVTAVKTGRIYGHIATFIVLRQSTFASACPTYLQQLI